MAVKKGLRKELNSFSAKDWFAIIGITVFASALILLANYMLSKNRLENQYVQQSAIGLEEANSGIKGHFKKIKSDLVLVSNEIRERYTKEPERYGRLQNTLANIILGNENIYEIRVISADGKEELKIKATKTGVSIANPDQLEDKSSHYYFKESKDLQADKLYLSRFDYNVENGVVERPLRPVLRIINKIKADDHSDSVLLVINYEGKALLSPIYSTIYKTPDITYALVHSDGTYILSSDVDRSWDFIQEQPKYNYYKELSTEPFYSSSELVSDEYKNGFYAYRNINLKSILEELGTQIITASSSKDFDWYISSTFTTEMLNDQVWTEILDMKYFILIECWILAVLLLIIYYFYQNRRYSKFKLLAQNEELEKQSKIKDDFYAIISHDLRSPFTGLIGLSSVLKDEADTLDTKEVKQYSNMIHQASEQTFQLLEKLLSWTKAQTSKIKVNPVEFKVYEMVKECAELYTAPLTDKQIDLSIEGNQELMAKADRAMIETILRNLINNAIKFTERNGEIFVKFTGDKKQFHIAVTDSGVGIDKSMLDGLFHINVNQTTKGTDNEQGTGLGLPLCKRLVELNDGKIYVASTLGKGTTFSFTIPNVIE